MKNKTIYHLVPRKIYENSINRLGNYNCSGFEKSKYMHTTVGLKEMKRVGDLLFTKTMNKSENPKAGIFYKDPKVEFVLLTIDRSKVSARMGFVKSKFYHIYGSIPKQAFKVKSIKRDKKGRFILN